MKKEVFFWIGGILANQGAPSCFLNA